jgi:hypothetical protein
MAAATFACPKCQTEFEASSEMDRRECACLRCGSELEAFFFPALFRPRQTGVAATMLVDQTEASCFYHAQKQATQVCDGCGRLICALCSIDLAHEHLCPNCISSGRRKGKITTLETSRTCYDRVALSLSILGILFYVFSIILTPVVIYITIRHWNSPGSVLGVSKVRFVIAIILASLELLGWFAFAFTMIYASHR